MEEEITVGFTEQSKAVTATVKVTGGDNPLAKAKALMEEAMNYSKVKTLHKLR